jgi:biofilm protein TabA
MILDSFSNSDTYLSVHPEFKIIFDYLKSRDLSTLPLGMTEINDSVYFTVAEMQPKGTNETKLEVHKSYIDIQIPIDDGEIMGWSALNTLAKPIGIFDEKADFQLFDDVATNLFKVNPGQFVIFFPSDGHQPGICDANHKKIIVKILAK